MSLESRTNNGWWAAEPSTNRSFSRLESEFSAPSPLQGHDGDTANDFANGYDEESFFTLTPVK